MTALARATPPPAPPPPVNPAALARKARRAAVARNITDWNGEYDAPCPHGHIVTWYAWHAAGCGVDTSTAGPYCHCTEETA